MQSIGVPQSYRRLSGYNLGPWKGSAVLVAASLAVLGLLILRTQPAISVGLWGVVGVWLTLTALPADMAFSIGTVMAKESAFLSRRSVRWVNAPLVGEESSKNLPGSLAKVAWAATDNGAAIAQASKREWTAQIVAEAEGVSAETIDSAVIGAQQFIDQVGWTPHVQRFTWIVSHRPAAEREIPDPPGLASVAGRLLGGEATHIASEVGRTHVRIAVTFDPWAGPASGGSEQDRFDAIDRDLERLVEAAGMIGLREARVAGTNEMVTWLRDRFDPTAAPHFTEPDVNVADAVGFAVTERRSHIEIGGADAVSFVVRSPGEPDQAQALFNSIIQTEGASNLTLALTVRPEAGGSAHRALGVEQSGAAMRKALSRRSAVAEVDSLRSQEQALSIAMGGTLAKFAISGSLAFDPTKQAASKGLTNGIGNGSVRMTIAHSFHLAVFLDTLGVGIPAVRGVS